MSNTIVGDDNQVISTDETTKDVCDMQDWKDRWANRRRMAWAAFAVMFLTTMLLYFAVPLDKIDKLADVTIWLYGTMASIILGYMGTTVSAHIFDRRR